MTWFEHYDRCCFGHLEGKDAVKVYGCDPAEVVQYGHWSWPSWSVMMVPEMSAGTAFGGA